VIIDKSGFSFTKNNPLLLYGAGNIAGKLLPVIREAGYNVAAVMDREPKKAMVSGVPVITAGQGARSFGVDIPVAITIGNMRPIKAAYDLRYAYGFKNIFFNPFILRSFAAREMSKMHTAFISSGIFTGTPLRSYDNLFKIHADDYVFHCDESYVTVTIDKTYIYQTSKERCREIENNGCFIHRYSEDYYDSATSNEYFSEKPLEDLSKVLDFHHYESGISGANAHHRNMMKDASEFFYHPATVVYNREKRIFHIIDGRHRVVFLLEHGFTGIPVRMKKAEWIEYFREPEAQAMMDYCKKLETLPMEIKHPAFILFPVKEREPEPEFVRLYNDLLLPRKGKT